MHRPTVKTLLQTPLCQVPGTTPKRWFNVEHIISRFNFNLVQMNWCALTCRKIPHYLRVYQGWKYGLCMGWTRKVTKFLPTVESWRTQQLALCLVILYVDICQLKNITQYILERLNFFKWLFQNVSLRSIMAEIYFLFFLWAWKQMAMSCFKVCQSH
jgi:hypothetical protein